MEQHFSMRNPAGYDSDLVRAQQVIAALDLNANENMTQQLRSGLANCQIEKIVETSLAKLVHHPDFSSIGEGGLAMFRQGWLDYLLDFTRFSRHLIMSKLNGREIHEWHQIHGRIQSRGSQASHRAWSWIYQLGTYPPRRVFSSIS